MAAADLSGDGLHDVLSTSIDDDKVAWYEFVGGHTAFGPQQLISSSADGAECVATADIDGDGDQDVLSASSLDDTIAWYVNTDGAGTFGPASTISSAADGARSVVAADVDGDGHPDALSASFFDDTIAWYENADGAGSFGSEQVVTTLADGALAVFAADLDGDGDQDVLSASVIDDEIAWYENADGLGGYGPQQVIANTASLYSSVHAADLDDDGDQDVLSTADFSNQVAWYENTDGNGAFGPVQAISSTAGGAAWVVAGDVDGDGDQDVVAAAATASEIAWFENGGCDFALEATATVRLGTPPNPMAFVVGSTSGPLTGSVWDPVIDHTSFVTDAVLDVYAISLTAVNVPAPPLGTVLCGPPLLARFRFPGIPFNLPIPDDCSIAGVALCASGGSFDADLDLFLTNALDVTIGTF